MTCVITWFPWFLLMGWFVLPCFWPPIRGRRGRLLHFSSSLHLLQNTSRLEFLGINFLGIDLLVSFLILKLWGKLKYTTYILHVWLVFINVIFLPLRIWDWTISMGMGSPGSQRLKNLLSNYEIDSQVPFKICRNKRMFYHILGQIVRTDVVEQEQVWKHWYHGPAVYGICISE